LGIITTVGAGLLWRESRTGKEFSFETVTVNRRGEIINREQKKAEYITLDLGSGASMDLVYVPGGTFVMGSPESEKDSQDTERSQHRVTVPSFYMGKYQVTQAQWQAIMGTNPARFKGENRPIESVLWDDCREFCNKLSQRVGREVRLPSEAEWEYACRAGTTTPFHFGETITGELANYYAPETYADETPGEYRQETTPVGEFPPNAFGLYDMHGNVWEWCQDHWHKNYEGAPDDGTAWLTDDKNAIRIVRGGSWSNDPRNCRSACRSRNDYLNAAVFGWCAFPPGLLSPLHSCTLALCPSVDF
jgi:formylglycine-generating enzyme required for sulfatase activity